MGLIFLNCRNAQVKIHKAEIPEAVSAKAIGFVNDAMDKFPIEKVLRASAFCRPYCSRHSSL
jgi:hypothetical protein